MQLASNGHSVIVSTDQLAGQPPTHYLVAQQNTLTVRLEHVFSVSIVLKLCRLHAGRDNIEHPFEGFYGGQSASNEGGEVDGRWMFPTARGSLHENGCFIPIDWGDSDGMATDDSLPIGADHIYLHFPFRTLIRRFRELSGQRTQQRQTLLLSLRLRPQSRRESQRERARSTRHSRQQMKLL
jgi:hypothetical protein